MPINKKHYIHGGILPPQNILAEEVIIGHLLSECTARKYITKCIYGNFFVLKKHQIIYSQITKAKKKRNTFSTISIVTTLRNAKLLDKAGGIKSITSAIQKSQTLVAQWHQDKYLEYFVHILHYHYTKRLFTQYSYNILQLSYIQNISLKQIYHKCIEYLKILQNSSSTAITANQNNIGNLLRRINQSTAINQSTTSGFKDLDAITNGFKPGELIIVAGRPSMGKTSFAINITHHAITQLKLSTYIFSLEMSKQEILDKLLAILSNITLQLIQGKTINEYSWPQIQKACKTLIASKLHVDDEGNASVDYIKSRCKHYIIKNAVVIIDYLQLIKFSSNSVENRSQEIGTITRELKLLAKYIKSPIITLSQLNRKIENRVNKQPMLSDLRESGCISYSNLPKIQKHYRINRIETLQCNNQSYAFNPASCFQIYRSKAQYVYSCRSYRKNILNATHNHKILTEYQWLKKDQIKKQNYHSRKLENHLNLKNILELNILQYIHLKDKTNVYDIVIYEHCNFIIQQQIVHNSIEQDADLILMLYKSDENLYNNKLDVIIAKHRNGPTGAFQLLFHSDKCKFENINSNNLLTSNTYKL